MKVFNFYINWRKVVAMPYYLALCVFVFPIFGLLYALSVIGKYAEKAFYFSPKHDFLWVKAVGKFWRKGE